MAPLDIVFGAMSFGDAGFFPVRTSDVSLAGDVLDTFQKHGHSEVDTSRMYGTGTSEAYLGKLEWQKRGLVMGTKFYPNPTGMLGKPTHLTGPDMREALKASLTALNADSVDLWYLHAPDRTVPLAETMKAVDELYKEGKFRRFGVSNFMAWEVAAICELCIANNWVRPTVYQGPYNALHRTIENELLPCLRKYGLAFYAFNPLAGGYLTNRYHRDNGASIEKGSRFDSSNWQGKAYQARYFHDSFFDALEALRPVVKEHGIRESEAALRWIVHHSQLKKELGDKVIIGASSVEQLEMNLKDFEGGELPADVVEVFNKGWEGTRGVVWKYFH